MLSDILGTDDDVTSRGVGDEVDKKLLKASISKLNSREKNIMELRFGFKTGEEKTQKEVADMLGISQSYISRLEKKIINKMKKEILSKTGWIFSWECPNWKSNLYQNHILTNALNLTPFNHNLITTCKHTKRLASSEVL